MKSQANYDAEAVTQFEHEAEVARISTEAWRQITQQFPAVEPLECNFLLLKDYWHPNPISVEGFKAAMVPGASDLSGRLALRDNLKMREDFASIIAAGSATPEYTKATLLQSFKVSEHFGDTAIASKPVFTDAQLQEKAAEAERRRAARDMKPHQLREVVRNSKTGFPYPPLPAEFTAERMRRKDFSPTLLRQLIRVHSATAVTNRLQGLD